MRWVKVAVWVMLLSCSAIFFTELSIMATGSGLLGLAAWGGILAGYAVYDLGGDASA